MYRVHINTGAGDMCILVNMNIVPRIGEDLYILWRSEPDQKSPWTMDIRVKKVRYCINVPTASDIPENHIGIQEHSDDWILAGTADVFLDCKVIYDEYEVWLRRRISSENGIFTP